MNDMYSMLIAMLAALVYAGSHYIKKAMILEHPQRFDPYKFISTLAFGAIVGILAFLSGTPITEEHVAAQFAAYFTFVVVLENVTKTMMRGAGRDIDNRIDKRTNELNKFSDYLLETYGDRVEGIAKGIHEIATGIAIGEGTDALAEMTEEALSKEEGSDKDGNKT